MDSLWGNLDKPIINKSPRMILQEQINYLNKMTDGSVEGELIQRELHKLANKKTGDEYGYNFSYVFNLKSKFIKGFKYYILSIAHDVIIYPLYIRINMDFAEKLKEHIIKEFADSDEFDEYDFEQHGEIFVENETEYIKLLSVILKSEEVLNVISNIKLIVDEQIENLF